MQNLDLTALYEASRLTNNKLQNIKDILSIYGVDVKAVLGYNELDENNRKLYEDFIVNFYNAFGLETRVDLIPKRICYVEHIEYLGKENSEDYGYMVLGSKVTSISKDNKRKVIHTWKDPSLVDLKAIKEEKEYYLRFEYQLGKRKTSCSERR